MASAGTCARFRLPWEISTPPVPTAPSTALRISIPTRGLAERERIAHRTQRYQGTRVAPRMSLLLLLLVLGGAWAHRSHPPGGAATFSGAKPVLATEELTPYRFDPRANALLGIVFPRAVQPSGMPPELDLSVCPCFVLRPQPGGFARRGIEPTPATLIPASPSSTFIPRPSSDRRLIGLAPCLRNSPNRWSKELMCCPYIHHLRFKGLTYRVVGLFLRFRDHSLWNLE